MTWHVSDHLADDRKNLIRLELMMLGIGTDNQSVLYPSLVEALYRIMTAIPHENRLPSTGIILFSHPYEEYGTHNTRFKPPKLIRPESAAEESVWGLADGQHSFVLVDSVGVGLLLLDEPITDEMSLFAFRDDALFDDEQGPSDPVPRDCIIVHRAADHLRRRLTVLCKEKIVTFSGVRYTAKSYQYETLRSLRAQVSPFPWDVESIQTVKSALRIAVHQLSPGGTGATLVVLAPDDKPLLSQAISKGDLIVDEAVRPGDWNVTTRERQRPLVHLISQYDGATVIESDGSVTYVGAFFREGRHITGLGREAHRYGTRHQSACEFSSLINGIVVVVSSDGPVTVFAGGKVVG